MTIRSDSSDDTLKVLGEQVRKILPMFSDLEQDVLKLRFNLDGKGFHTLEMVASNLGITRKEVRKIEVRAIHLSRQQ